MDLLNDTMPIWAIVEQSTSANIRRPKDYPWRFVGKLTRAAAKVECSSQQCNPRPPSLTPNAPATTPRQEVRLRLGKFTIDGKTHEVFVGQCPVCGFVYWGRK